MKKKTNSLISVTLFILAIILLVGLIGTLTKDNSRHKHTLVHIAATAPTCTECGNVEYWQCKSCFKRFSDKGKTELKEIEIAATGHNCDSSFVCIYCGDYLGTAFDGEMDYFFPEDK